MEEYIFSPSFGLSAPQCCLLPLLWSAAAAPGDNLSAVSISPLHLPQTNAWITWKFYIFSEVWHDLFPKNMKFKSWNLDMSFESGNISYVLVYSIRRICASWNFCAWTYTTYTYCFIKTIVKHPTPKFSSKVSKSNYKISETISIVTSIKRWFHTLAEILLVNWFVGLASLRRPSYLIFAPFWTLNHLIALTIH